MGRERGLPKVDRNEPMIKFLRDKNLLCQLEPGAVSAPAYTGGFYLSDTAPGSNWHTSQTLFSDTCETPLSSSHSRPLINSSTKKNQTIESRYYIFCTFYTCDWIFESVQKVLSLWNFRIFHFKAITDSVKFVRMPRDEYRSSELVDPR